MIMTIKCNYKRILFDVLLAVYLGLSIFLYYNQLLYPLTGKFESDTAVHVRFAVEEGYYHSLAAFIYIFLSKLWCSNFLIATVLGIATVGSIIATKFLIDKILSVYGENISDFWKYTFSFTANFCMGFYIKAANKQHYIGYESANMWHNSTYIFMRLFAVLTVLYFLNIYESYQKGIRASQWCIFTLLLAVATGFKASFLTVFAPLLGIMLLIDLIKGTKFKNVFIMGTSVFPSLLIMYIQSRVMSGEGGSNGYVISPFTALSMRGDHPKATLILSVLFPLTVLAFHLKDFYKDKIYFGALIMWGIAFLEVFLLAESGERSLDGNFMWGYFISLFFVFLISMIKMIRSFFIDRMIKPVRATVIFSFTGVILLWHFISGIWYFCLLLTGVTYFV